MERTLKIILTLFFIFVFKNVFCQNETALCKAVANSNFRKVERIVKKVIKENKTGQTYFNGEGSGYQINLSPCFDSITNWFKKQDCVEDAYWDKCQTKVEIYPGHSSIGVKFRTNSGIVEKCFQIQEGTTGQINFLGWRPKISKEKKQLVYKRMYEYNGFIELQKLNCYPYFKRERKNETIIPQNLKGIWQMIMMPIGTEDKGIEFKMNAQNELELTVDSLYTYSFTNFFSKTALSGLGCNDESVPYFCFVKMLDDNFIQVEYKSLGVEPFTITYLRLKFIPVR